MITIGFNIGNPAERLSWAIRSNIINAVKVGMKDAEYISKVELLSGKGRAKTILNYRSGRLFNSVKGVGYGGPKGFIATGELSSEGVEYAAIHEYGGVIAHPGAKAHNVYMKWYSKLHKRIIRARQTEPHDIVIPKRSFLERAIKLNTANMEAKIARAIEVALKEV